MLIYEKLGPGADGRYMVVYQPAGSTNPTVACAGIASSRAADDEVSRLNKVQIQREVALRAHARARSLHTYVYPALAHLS